MKVISLMLTAQGVCLLICGEAANLQISDFRGQMPDARDQIPEVWGGWEAYPMINENDQ